MREVFTRRLSADSTETSFSVPDVQMPDVQVPDVQPDVQVPDVQMPDFQMPDVQVPDVQPDVQVPDVQVPDVQMPDVQMPDVQVPDVQVPDVQMPDVQPDVWFKIGLMMSDEIISNNTKLILRAHSHPSGRRRRKQKVIPSERSSPEDSRIIPSQIPLSITRTEWCEKMHDGDFIINIDSQIFYRDLYTENKSLEYLSNRIQNIKNYSDFNPKYLENNYNDTFNELLNNLDEDTKNSIKAKEQLACVFFRRKDGSFDNNRTKVLKLKCLSVGEHTEDEIIILLLQIYQESNCDYSEMYVFSTNNPCLARKDYLPCMIGIFVMAYKLNVKHGIKTITGYTKYYGLNGSYDNHLPFYPSKVCIYTFDSQTLGSKDLTCAPSKKKLKTKKHTKVDLQNVAFLNPVYELIIAEEQNTTFKMRDTVSKPQCNLKESFPEISDSIIYKKLNTIKDDLFKIDPELNKTFDDFHTCVLERFDTYSKEIRDLLIKCDTNIYEIIHKHLQTLFFPWWAKTLEEASSKFLNEKLNHKLQNGALHLFSMDTAEIKKKMGIHFFEIGLVNFKY
ncbi:hypothetical protein PO909_003840 [Leuciscus waleckii]